MKIKTKKFISLNGVISLCTLRYIRIHYLYMIDININIDINIFAFYR